MRVETKTETIVKEINTYFADDGKEFATRADCEKYESLLKKKETEGALWELRIPELDDITPLHSDPNDFTWYHDFKWYKVNNEDDVNKLEQMYVDAGYIINSFNCDTYPNLLGIEEADNEVYSYTLTEMKDFVKRFFEDNFDIEVEYKRKEEPYGREEAK